MDEKVEYYKLPLYKRIISLVMDISFVVILFTFFLFPVSKILESRLNKNEVLMESIDNMNDILLDSGLFIFNENGVMVEDISDKGITNGYIYLGKLDEYLSIKNDSELFKLENDTYIEIGTEEEILKFYKDNWLVVYNKVVLLDSFVENNKVYVEIMDEHSGITYTISIVASIGILILIIPFIDKKGRTVSKMLFKISVVDEDYENFTRMQIFVMLVSVITILPLVISITTIMFEKRGKSLHDYISFTRLVDSNLQKTILEEKKKKQELKELDFK